MVGLERGYTLLGADTQENAERIKKEVVLDGVEIAIVYDPLEMAKFTEVPSRVPPSHALIVIGVAKGTNIIELMRKMSESLQKP